MLGHSASIVAGLLLLLALGIGTFGAFRLLRAAHGRPRVVSIEKLPPEVVAQHTEALEAARQLRQGIVATTLCGALLISAVALTWYGPPKVGPMLRLEAQGKTMCGAVTQSGGGTMLLATAQGDQSVALSTVQGIAVVAQC
jgi:hypothetical protein